MAAFSVVASPDSIPNESDQLVCKSPTRLVTSGQLFTAAATEVLPRIAPLAVQPRALKARTDHAQFRSIGLFIVRKYSLALQSKL
jgi:hypothetical protein